MDTEPISKSPACCVELQSGAGGIAARLLGDTQLHSPRLALKPQATGTTRGNFEIGSS